jgi:hypothetical protein
MKTLIISMPKAGTYLCSNLLVEFKIKQTFLHLNSGNYQQYSANNLREAKKNPKKFTHNKRFRESIKLFGDNEFAVTHVPYSAENGRITRDMKRILLTRNENEIKQSYQRWNKNTGRRMPPNIRYDQIRKWTTEKNIFVLSFNDMINKNVEAIDGLQLYLFNEIKFNSEECIQRALNMPSMTKMR